MSFHFIFPVVAFTKLNSSTTSVLMTVLPKMFCLSIPTYLEDAKKINLKNFIYVYIINILNLKISPKLKDQVRNEGNWVYIRETRKSVISMIYKCCS